mmetsp:Transcript_40532/g.63594  ORF Transcript_40532/g.63594 Transcript_40532/m.63594 type:complete len:220 (+) Transcript_40532:115-774(+)
MLLPVTLLRHSTSANSSLAKWTPVGVQATCVCNGSFALLTLLEPVPMQSRNLNHLFAVLTCCEHWTLTPIMDIKRWQSEIGVLSATKFTPEIAQPFLKFLGGFYSGVGLEGCRRDSSSWDALGPRWSWCNRWSSGHPHSIHSLELRIKDFTLRLPKIGKILLNTSKTHMCIACGNQSNCALPHFGCRIAEPFHRQGGHRLQRKAGGLFWLHAKLRDQCR